MRMPIRILMPLLATLVAGLSAACGGDRGEGPTGPSSAVVGTTAVGLWISAPELAALPESGPGWANVFNQAQQRCRTPSLSDQENQGDVCLMSKALVFARTGEPGYRDEVISALSTLTTAAPYRGRALSLGRQLPALVVAADLIDLPRAAPDLDGR